MLSRDLEELFLSKKVRSIKIFTVVLFTAILFIAGFFVFGYVYSQYSQRIFLSNIVAKQGKNIKPEVLAETSIATDSSRIAFYVPAVFNRDANVNSNFRVNGSSNFIGNSSFQGQVDILGNAIVTGNLTAPNIIYSVVAGEGISISTGQNPVITNLSPGNAQNIFKNIEIDGSDIIKATANNDTLKLVSGDGISIATDGSGKTITFAAEKQALPDTGLTYTSGVLRLTTLTDRFSIGSKTATSAFNVGAGNDFQITSAGAIASATGITSSGSITFSSLSSGLVRVDSNGTLSVNNTGFENPLTFTNGINRNGNTISLGGNLIQSTILNGGGTNNFSFINGNMGIGNSTPTSLFTVGDNNQFQVNLSGDITRINNVAYSFPSQSGGVTTYLKNDGSGNLTWSGILGTGVNSGSAGYFSYYQSQGSEVSQQNILFTDGTNVGIGTTNPTSPFVVNASASNGVSAQFLGKVIGVGGTGNNDFVTYSQMNSTVAGSAAWSKSGSYVYLVDLTNNVGIGNSTPTSLFTVGDNNQ
ncbi:MAG: hypothetical protein WCO06_05280, partial [Candidatus Roizmanbacteria bacterium]